MNRIKNLIVLIGLLGCGHLRAADVPDLLLVDHSQGLVMIRASDGRMVWKQEGKRLYEAWAQADGSIVYNTGGTVERIANGQKTHLASQTPVVRLLA